MEDEKNGLPMKFNEACEFFGDKPPHSIASHMRGVVKAHQESILDSYEVTPLNMLLIMHNIKTYLGDCTAPDEHEFEIDLGDGFIFFADALVTPGNVGTASVELTNIRVWNPDVNINYLSDEQIAEIEKEFN